MKARLIACQTTIVILVGGWLTFTYLMRDTGLLIPILVVGALLITALSTSILRLAEGPKPEPAREEDESA
ncbi:hypothetical protein [Microbispora sp. NBRC 16548]|uniref:hypothetical protein n=1 Tax=Microbispora sp. NBRC 16548 TaxID=3030994 RepID=UPI0024A17EF0|nr:hypothetical protein [Microbispora sp. NBRC 16548]GLX06738.1 hypothetical protein Misp03_36650 [Microbispora sp. NBRC 16548]